MGGVGRPLAVAVLILAVALVPGTRSAQAVSHRAEASAGLAGPAPLTPNLGDPLGLLDDPAVEPAVGGGGPEQAVAALVPPEPRFMQLAGGTTVTPEHFYSNTLDKGTWYEVILPPDYASSDRRYPVLYMLHGAAGGAGEWVEIGLHQAADVLWSEQAYTSFIIVLPDGDGSTYYLNHANGGPRYGDYIAGDVVQQIDATYRTLAAPEFRAIGGLSMGGDGALQLALHHPDIFGVVGAHSPTTRLSYDRIPGPFYGDEAYWLENNPLWLIRNTDAAEKLSIWIDMGEDDPWIPSARALRDALEEREIDFRYAEFEGSHEAEYWEAYQGEYLRFYARMFERALETHEQAGRPALAAAGLP